MNSIELPLVLFAGCNLVRIAAYVPQMLKIVRHPHGAAGFSFATWSLFAAADGSTAFYARSALGDVALASVHRLSARCCVPLVSLAAWRRHYPMPGQRSGNPAA